MDLSIDPVLGFTSRLLLVLVFGTALLHKLRAPREFVAVLREYRLIPEAAAGVVAVLVIVAECFATLGIWWPVVRAWAAAVAVALLVVYAVAIGINIRRGRREIDCGCSFGSSAQPLSAALLVRNALLILPCTAAGLPVTGAIDGTGLLVGFLGAAALGLCYQLWGVLLANRPRISRLEDQ
jgi:hypothetical protein